MLAGISVVMLLRSRFLIVVSMSHAPATNPLVGPSHRLLENAKVGCTRRQGKALKYMGDNLSNLRKTESVGDRGTHTSMQQLIGGRSQWR